MSVVAVIDADPIIYATASVGEERYIEVTHLPSQRVQTFKNKTEFYGRGKKRDGGWLGDLNAKRLAENKPPFILDDFSIEECQRVKDELPKVLHSTKMTIAGAAYDVGADEYVCFIGGSAPLDRWKNSNLSEYKGNRKNSLKPLLKNDVANYIVKHQNGILCNDGKEADDWCIIEAVKEEKLGNTAIVITSDKDVLGCPVLSYNPDKPELGIQDGNQFGRLYLDDKRKVRGVGRIFKYWQWCYGDPVDNYFANAQSHKKWGEKSAFDVLVDCQNDRDAWKVVYDVYSMLYPEPKEIETWKGDTITIDRFYCMQEIFNNLHMVRWEGDYVDTRIVLEKYKII